MSRGQRGRGVWRVGALVGALICGLWLGQAAAQDQYPPPATAAPPTEPPPTSPPVSPPTAPPQSDDDEEAPPPPAQATELPTLAPVVTRTRRATRTPRTTATPTPAPVVVGALRATLAQEPAVAAPGGGLTLRLHLRNRDVSPAGDVTVELTLPPELEPGTARTDTGQVIPAGAAVRWYLPRLEPGATALLELPASVRGLPDVDSRVCLLLLSAASPLEHCIVPRVAVATATPEVGLAPDAGAEAPPLDGATDRTGPPPELAWLVLLSGLAVLGVWLGLRLRGRGR